MSRAPRDGFRAKRGGGRHQPSWLFSLLMELILAITTVSSSTNPVYGQTGGGMSHYSGMTSSGQLYSGTIMTPSQYGVVGSQTSTSRNTPYKRQLLVDVVDYQTLEKEQKLCRFRKERQIVRAFLTTFGKLCRC
jgi:hypothetical protein